MTVQVIKQVSEYVTLFRDTRTGIAWVENGSTGNGHSAHPNIHASGSVAGMKKRGHWHQNARVVRCRGFIYNTDLCVIDDPGGLDEESGQPANARFAPDDLRLVQALDIDGIGAGTLVERIHAR